MLSRIKANVLRNARSIPGWRSNRKIVVIESDDWGAIRMPSKQAYDSLLRAGIRVDNCPYNRFDNMASPFDLTNLFDVIRSVKDRNGRHPIITANTILTNPDFEKIKADRFQTYHYELFTQTLERYGFLDSFKIWKQGMDDNIFFPQLHGREHLQIVRWMNALKAGFKETHLAFEVGAYGISTTITSEKRKSYLAALDYDDLPSKQIIENHVVQATDLFEQLFSYRSMSFIAPNYVWDSSLEHLLAEKGVRFFQGVRQQQLPAYEKGKSMSHVLGGKNLSDQFFLIRNCFFEPSLSNRQNPTDYCLSEIQTAFRWNKPAVISTHRVNFIGSLDPMNASRNLKSFGILLKEIVTRWPGVEFLTSAQLGELVANKE